MIGQKLGAQLNKLKHALLKLSKSLIQLSQSYSKKLPDEDLAPQTPKATKYLFHQQVNSTCFISPMYNLHKLENLLKQTNKLTDIPDAQWATKRIWFGREYQYVITWHATFKQILSSKYPALQVFIKTGIDKGPVLPHMYTQENTFISNFNNIFSFYSCPYFIAHREALEKIYFDRATSQLSSQETTDSIRGDEFIANNATKMPFYQDENGFYYGYNAKQDNYYKMFTGDKNTLTNQITTPITHLSQTDARSLNNKKTFYAHKVNALNYTFRDEQTIPGALAEHQSETIMQPANLLGMPENAFDFSTPEITLMLNNQKYCFYLTGLYKLMLLRLGLDNNNHDISQDTKHPLYIVTKQLQDLFNKTENLWDNTYFTKEMLLQYHLAEIFGKNPELYKRTQNIVDFKYRKKAQASHEATPGKLLNPDPYYAQVAPKGRQVWDDKISWSISPWESYTQFCDNVKTSSISKTIYRSKEKQNKYTPKLLETYLPGDTQMLAYCVMSKVNSLLYGALNKHAFYKTADLEENIHTGWTFENFKTLAIEPNQNGDSFMSVWKEILNELNKLERKNFISFNGHGWVCSLDKNIIDLQIKKSEKHNKKETNNKCDIELLKDLGCINIDSWHGSELPMFYKK